MKKLVVLAVFASLATLGLSLPSSAQSIPDVHGLNAFTPQTNYMSLPGFVRWQYFAENKTWISRAEATSLVKSQAENK